MRIRLRDPKPFPVWIVSADDVADAYYRVTLPARMTGGRIQNSLMLGRDLKPTRPVRVLDSGATDALKGSTLTVSGLGSPTIFRAKDVLTRGKVREFVSALAGAGADIRIEWDDLFRDWNDLSRNGRMLAELKFRKTLHSGEFERQIVRAFMGRMGLSEAGARRALALAGGAAGLMRDAWNAKADAEMSNFYSANMDCPVKTMNAVRRHIVSTETLAHEIMAHGSGVDTCIAPNAIDPAAFRPIERTGPVRIGYAGTLTHWEDVSLVEDAFLQCARLPSVELHLWGWHPRAGECPETLAYDQGRMTEYKYSGCRYFYHGQISDIHEFYAEIGTLDVAVAPLLDTPFNRCKSSQKWYEHAMHSTAMVVSDLPPYECVEHGVTGLKARTAEEFTEYALMLCKDAALRKRIGNAAHDAVMACHTIAAYADEWREAVAR